MNFFMIRDLEARGDLYTVRAYDKLMIILVFMLKSKKSKVSIILFISNT